MPTKKTSYGTYLRDRERAYHAPSTPHFLNTRRGDYRWYDWSWRMWFRLHRQRFRTVRQLMYEGVNPNDIHYGHHEPPRQRQRHRYQQEWNDYDDAQVTVQYYP